MRPSLILFLLASGVGASGCSSPEAQRALVDAATATVLGVTAAVIEGAVQQEAERESAQRSRPHHVPNEPGTWHLIRHQDGDQCDPDQDDECTADNEEEENIPEPETGACMVCH